MIIIPSLGDAVSFTTTFADVELHFDSDIDSLNSYYSTYDVVVKMVAKPEESSLTIGGTVCTLTLTSPD